MLAAVGAEAPGSQIDGAVQKVEQERMAVEVFGRDRHLALRHGQHPGDPLGLQGCQGELPRCIVALIRGLPQELDHGEFGELFDAASLVNLPVRTGPDGPLLHEVAEPNILTMECQEPLGVAGVVEALHEQARRRAD